MVLKNVKKTIDDYFDNISAEDLIKKYEKMEYSSKIKLLENEVVHCDTEEKANLVLGIAHNLGYKRYTGKSFVDDTGFYYYREQTCYNILCGAVGYSSFYKDLGKTIISAEEFLSRHNITLSKESNVCKEVKEGINNDPVENFKRIATIASVLIGKEITAKDCCKIIMAIKLVCEADTPTLHTRVDICEYRNILDKMEK